LSRWLVVLLGVSACTPDVIVGINVRNDAGSADASVLLDAGEDDAGTADAGVPDAGTPDAGLPDGGAPDAGMLDAGAPGDGGPVDLLVGLTGDVVIDQNSIASYLARATNLGGSTALDASVIITLPPGLALRSSTQCTADGGVITCPVGDVLAGDIALATFTVDTDAGRGWRDLLVRAQTESPDVDAGNDTTTFFMAVTAPSALVFPVMGPRTVDINFCVGTNLTSYSMCTPPSLVTGSIELLPDGGLESDAGFFGQWAQSPHQRNIAWRFYVGSTFGARYAGVAVSASCFEGVIDTNGTYNRGAFQGCLP
jgi:hypothetical protein